MDCNQFEFEKIDSQSCKIWKPKCTLIQDQCLVDMQLSFLGPRAAEFFIAPIVPTSYNFPLVINRFQPHHNYTITVIYRRMISRIWNTTSLRTF